MNEYEQLENFSLSDHGDARERQWAKFVLPAFPAYEVFWRRYVVPLTNRIRTDVPQADENWVRMRPNAPARLEGMTMCHYSVFYYFARGIAQTDAQNREYPEDIFALLTACGDNVLKFSKYISNILADFGERTEFLPSQVKDLCLAADPQGCFVEANEYRNTMLHNSVLGRRAGLGRQYLPKREHLKRVSISWREAERLKPEELIESEALFSRLRDETALFLQQKWEQIISVLDKCRDSEKFKTQWALRELVPIASPKIGSLTVRVGLAVAVSPTATGTVILPHLTKDRERD